MGFFLKLKIISKVRIENRIIDEPTVPKLSPPFSVVLVNKSPNVAPNGRVKTKASQNNNTVEIFEKYFAITTKVNKPPINIAPPKNPSPESSAKKSPTAVPKVFEKSMAVQ